MFVKKSRFLCLSIILLFSVVVQNIAVLANSENESDRIITAMDEYSDFLLVDDSVLFIGNVNSGIKTKIADGVIDAQFGAGMNIIFLTENNIVKQYDRNTKDTNTILNDVKSIFAAEGYGFGWPTYIYYAIKNDSSLWGWGLPPEPKKLIENVKSIKSSCGGYVRMNIGDFVITNDEKVFELKQVYSGDGYTYEIKEKCQNATDVSRVRYGDASHPADIDVGEMTYYLKSNGELWGEGYNEKGNIQNPVRTEYELKKIADNVAKIDGCYFLDKSNNLYRVNYYDTEYLCEKVRPDNHRQQLDEFYHNMLLTESGQVFDAETKSMVENNFEVMELIDNYALTNTGLLYGLAPIMRYDAESDMSFTSAQNWLIDDNVSEFWITGYMGIVYKTANNEIYVVNEKGAKRKLLNSDDVKDKISLMVGYKNAVVFGKECWNDVAPKIVNDRTMLPARFVAENLGAEVVWNEIEPEKILIKKDMTEIILSVGSDIAYVNGKEVKLDSPAFVENDRTYTPVRFICEELGADVEWVEETQEVVITK